MDNSFSRQAKSFLKVKLRHLRRKTNEGKYDTRDKNLPHLQTVLSKSGPASRYRMQERNTFTVNVISCPSKQILGDLKTNLAIEMSQNNTLTHGKLQRCQTQRNDMHITAEITQTYDLLNSAIA